MRDMRFDLFGSESGIDERVFATGRTLLRHRGGMPAEMATQARGGAVKRERDAAIRTIARFAARAAEQ